MRVLCVDDNRDAATVMVMLIQAAGHEAQPAYDGPGAISLAESYRPDLVMLDLNLPGFDGCEVARQIRQQPWSEKVTLVALTGWDREEDRERTAAAGFHHHIIKPLGRDALIQLLTQSGS